MRHTSRRRDQISYYISNHPDALRNRLKGTLYASEDNFTRKLLVVPCDSVKRKIENSFCQDPEIGVFMGVRALNLNLAMSELFKCYDRKACFASQTEWALLIEKEIAVIVDGGSFGNHNEFSKYLSGCSDQRAAMTRLSDALAGLFLKYGLYFGPEWSGWKGKNQWQQRLIKKILVHFDLPIDAFSDPGDFIKAFAGYEVHLFGLPFIPAPYWDFLERISHHIPVSIYLLSYSELYWGDLVSKRQRIALEKQAIERVDYEDYLDMQNPLFSDLCQYGQRLFCDLIDRNIPVEESYIEIAPPENLLGYLQRDLFELCPPRESLEILSSIDRSIRIFKGPNRLREVENIYAQIMALHARDGIDIGDILVLSPSIDEYAPYIQYVFDGKQLGYRIEGVNAQLEGGIYKLLSTLVELFSSRWEKRAIIDLLEHPIISDKLMLDRNDLDMIRYWLDKTQMLWGYDDEHRQEFADIDTSRLIPHRVGTLESSLEQCLLSLAIGDGERSMSSRFTFPLSIDLSLAPLLERLKGFLDSLYSKIKKLKGASQSLHQWSSDLLDLFDEFASIQSSDYDRFRTKLKLFFKVGELTSKERYPWSTVEYYLKEAMASKNGVLQSSQSVNVRFAPIDLGEEYFVDALIFMGMDQGIFPRQSTYTSLDQLRHREKRDYVPEPSHIDRYIFLGALCNVKKALIFSYCYQDSEGRAQGASSCVNELLAHLDRTFSFEGEKVSDHILQTLDPTPFTPQALDLGCKPLFFDLATTYQNRGETSSKIHRLPYLSGGEKLGKDPMRLDIRKLEQALRNPIKYTCQNGLGLFREARESQEEWLREFKMSPIDRASIRMVSDQEVDWREQLPISSPLFADYAALEVEGDRAHMDECMNALSIHSDELFTVRLVPDVEGVREISSGVFEHPSIRLGNGEGGEIELIGEINHLSKKGLVHMGKGLFPDIFKTWPSFLVVQALSSDLVDDGSLILLQKGDVKPELKFDWQLPIIDMVRYAEGLKSEISIALPQLVEALLFQDRASFEKEVHALYDESSWMSRDPYLQWLFFDAPSFLAEVNYDEISENIQGYFSHFISWIGGDDE